LKSPIRTIGDGHDDKRRSRSGIKEELGRGIYTEIKEILKALIPTMLIPGG